MPEEIVPDQIWQMENVLAEPLLQAILKSIESGKQKAQTVTSENTTPKFCYSGFHYLHLPLEEPLRQKAYQSILQALSQIDPTLPMQQNSSRELSYSTLFLKGFVKGSHYHLHAEDRNVFGSLAYILYLSDEDTGRIIFPRLEDLPMVAEDEELKNWQIMESYLKANRTTPKYLDKTLEMSPRRNQLIAFRIGLVHKVEEFLGPDTGRFCFTGFPGATIP